MCLNSVAREYITAQPIDSAYFANDCTKTSSYQTRNAIVSHRDVMLHSLGYHVSTSLLRPPTPTKPRYYLKSSGPNSTWPGLPGGPYPIQAHITYPTLFFQLQGTGVCGPHVCGAVGIDNVIPHCLLGSFPSGSSILYHPL